MNSLLTKYLVHFPFHLLNGQKLWEYQEQFENTQWLPRDRIEEIRWGRCRQMLQYGYDNVPYYRKKFTESGIHPGDIRKVEDYVHVPMLTKEGIRENYEELICNTRKWKGFPRKTSGSSGSPLRIEKDGEALAVMDAVMFRNYDWFEVKIGDRQARFWGSPLDGVGKAETQVKDYLLNRIRFSPFDLSDRSNLEYYRRLRRFQPKFIYGYAQTVYNFSEFLMRNGYDTGFPGLRAVILTGEMIYDDQVRVIEETFRCHVSNEYGCTETGVIAMSCPAKKMHLMAENLLVEFLKDGRPVEGEEEGEIVITELYGKIMPLIRYKIEDIGSPGTESCPCGRNLPLMKNLKGRSDDFISCPDGKRIDPIFFDYILKSLPGKIGSVTQFRIVQETDFHLEIGIRYRGGKPEAALNAIRSKIAEVTGGTIAANVWITDEFPAEPSGKLRCFVSRIKTR